MSRRATRRGRRRECCAPSPRRTPRAQSAAEPRARRGPPDARSHAWIVAGSAWVARAICASLIGTRSSSPIRRSAGAIVGGEPGAVIARSAGRKGGGSRSRAAADRRRASATPRRSRRSVVSQTRTISSAISPLRWAVMRCQPERSSTARSSPSGSQKPARISISTVPGYDRQPAIRPGSAPPSTLRAACVIPATSVPTPKSPGEIGVYSALGPEGIPAKRLFPTWRGSEPKDDLERSWTIRAQLRRRS